MSIVSETAAEPIADDVLIPSDDVGGAVVLHGVKWKLYRRLRKMRANYNLRMTYDRGELEIMSPSAEHESIARLLRSLVEAWTAELNIEIVPCRTLTVRRADLKRGFEPDDCYYVQHELEMRAKKKINFKVDPPPDLAIEVEIGRKLGGKIDVYAAFRVPELWCWRADGLKLFGFAQSGGYAPLESSICFPNFPVAKAEETVRRLGTIGYTSLVRSFRDWVQANFAAKEKTP
jgi:Uma2 family endonuclease